jgi:fumarate hydratase subunit beta
MKKYAVKLKAGDRLSFTGTLYTARDQAHKRLVEALRKGGKLPIRLKGAVIYYCGPTGTPKGAVIGSCGPTTASRMDKYAPALLKAGIAGMIGKGRRSEEVRLAVKKYKAEYFLTLAGCGALLATKVRSAKVAAYRDLGPEAIYRLEVEDFPLLVAIDSSGRSIYGKK